MVVPCGLDAMMFETIERDGQCAFARRQVRKLGSSRTSTENPSPASKSAVADFDTLSADLGNSRDQ
jgi:hypothetical protein